MKSPLFRFTLTLVAIAILARLGPPEATLGVNARVVYLHGAWVWAALAGFAAAGATGLWGLVRRLPAAHRWSRALGRAGLFFWITYLPISLWAMQTNWNGIFLAEPRWRVAAVFAVAGVLLQLGLSFLPVSWASFWNLVYAVLLFFTLAGTENVMHPPSPILDSNAWRIQLFFSILNLLVLLAAWQVARAFHYFERPSH